MLRLLSLLALLALCLPLTACDSMCGAGDPTMTVRLPVKFGSEPRVQPTSYGMLVPAQARMATMQVYQQVEQPMQAGYCAPAAPAAGYCAPAQAAPAYSTPYNWAPPPVQPAGAAPCR